LVSLALAAVAGGLVVVVAGWPRGSLVPEAVTPTPQAPLASASSSMPHGVVVQPSPAGIGEVVVDVDGAVRRPGVVTLPDGSRVVDAIKAAGGQSSRADTGSLNLAQVLMDGEQVIVPRRGSPGQAASPGVSVAPGLVNLNTATATELETLPGIGPVLAAAIVDWRTQNGGFTSVDQLEQVSGIGPATFAELASLVRV
jgi:competence protein ComEA